MTRHAPRRRDGLRKPLRVSFPNRTSGTSSGSSHIQNHPSYENPHERILIRPSRSDRAFRNIRHHGVFLALGSCGFRRVDFRRRARMNGSDGFLSRIPAFLKNRNAIGAMGVGENRGIVARVADVFLLRFVRERFSYEKSVFRRLFGNEPIL